MSDKTFEAARQDKDGKGKAPSASHEDKASARKPRRHIKRARTAVCLAVVLLVLAGFAFDSGWGTLCAAGVDSIAALCPLGSLEALLASKLAVPQVAVSAVCMLAIVALLGRSFCAWACPIPPIRRFFRPSGSGKAKAEGGPFGDSACASADSDADAAQAAAADSSSQAGHAFAADSDSQAEELSLAPAEALTEREKSLLRVSCRKGACALAPLGGKRDGVHLDSRHAVLAGALASSAVFGFPVFCLVCPVGLTFATLIAAWRAIVDHDPTWMLVVFPAILLLELVVFRKWCHALCPIGALMSLVGAKAPVGKPRVDNGKCLRCEGVDCRACVNACPEGLDPHSATLSECTRCGLCVEQCPARAIKLGVLPPRSKRG